MVLGTKTLKIVIFTKLYPPKWIGGTEIETQYVARSLVELGNDVYVVVSKDDDLPEHTVVDGVHIYRIAHPRIRYLGGLIFWLKSASQIKRIRPDIVHIPDLGNGGLGLIVNAFLRLPYVVWAQGSDVNAPSRFQSILSRFVIMRAAIVISLSEDMKKRILGMARAHRIIVLHIGVDYERFRSCDTERRHFDKTITILYVGSLLRLKGVNYLVEAMRIIARDHKRVRLLIIGDGACRSELEAQVRDLCLEDSIFFIGRIKNEEICNYMSQASIFVLPSLSEGLPLVVLEAFAAGLPVIATRVGGIPEILEDGKNGFLVEPRNPEEIAKNISLLLSNSELRQDISKRNLIVAEQHSWLNIAKHLVDAYSDCIRHDSNQNPR